MHPAGHVSCPAKLCERANAKATITERQSYLSACVCELSLGETVDPPKSAKHELVDAKLEKSATWIGTASMGLNGGKPKVAFRRVQKF